MPRTLKQLAQEALDVQGACNMLAVVNGLARCVKDLRELSDTIFLPIGWEGVDAHPIVRLWIDKIASLSGLSLDSDGYAGAYEAVSDLAEAPEPPCIHDGGTRGGVCDQCGSVL